MNFVTAVSGFTIAYTTRDEGSFTQSEKIEQYLRQFTKAPISLLKREHSDQVVNIDSNHMAVAAEATITANSHVLTLPVADCYPVVFIDPIHRAIALIHAGWRPLLLNILALTLHRLQLDFNTDTSQLQVWIGPGIRKEAFVQSDIPVQANFIKWKPFISQLANKQHSVDLPSFILSELEHLGVNSSYIYEHKGCTFSEKDVFFSHRRATLEGDEDGRMLVAVWKN